MNINEIERVHMIGVGGIGMSGLARLFLHEGKRVSGSDRAPSAITDALAREGVEFFTEQRAENVSADVDLVVYTEAMAKDHPEMVAARDQGAQMMNYFEALGAVANQYHLIAVAGSHGKTTTTAMLIDILEEAGADPTAIVGSLRNKTGSNFRAGRGKYFIVEACEYRRDFLTLTPDVLVVTNIEYEHPDYYRDLADVEDAFRTLVRQVREGGVVVADTGSESVARVLAGCEAEVIDYRKVVDPLLVLRAPGLHNQLNAAAAKAAAAEIGIGEEIANSALAAFSGTWRRFEYKGETGGAAVYDDYGHHPSEIKVTLAAARERHPGAGVTLVFQPHMYSRTHELFSDFVRELGKADRVILAPIYAAREQNESGVSSARLAAEIVKVGGNAEAYETLAEVRVAAKAAALPNTVILIMGAGDITEVAGALVTAS